MRHNSAIQSLYANKAIKTSVIREFKNHSSKFQYYIAMIHLIMYVNYVDCEH